MPDQPFDPRQRKRTLTMFTGIAKADQGESTGMVMNLSEHGVCFRIADGENADIGASVVIVSEKCGRLSGVVHWRRGEVLGIRLDPTTNTAAQIASYYRYHC